MRCFTKQASLRRVHSFSALLAVGLMAPLAAQGVNNLGLQGHPTLLTPGGWLWPAADPGNPQPNPATPYLTARIQLGKALFWDEQVSTSNMIACATCHMPEAGGLDPRPGGNTFNSLGQPILGSFGVMPQAMVAGQIDYGFVAPPSLQSTRGITPIHVPTMIGAYMFNNQFWDLRAGPAFNFSSGAGLLPNWSSLENQAVGPPTSDIEMGHQNVAWATGVIEAKLNQAAPLALAVPGTIPPTIPPAWLGMNYQAVFNAVFGASTIPAIAAPVGVTRERFGMALAAYMRTLVPDQAPIDTNTMTTSELLGFDVFVGSGCATCHSASGAPVMVNRAGPIGTLADPWDNLFSDGLARDIFPTRPGRSIGPIKTPTLRNVGLRTRFFHDGHGRIVAGVPNNTIPAIVDFYDIDQDSAFGGPGGPFELRSLTGAPGLTPLERNGVIAFLGNALTDQRVATGSPPFDHPTLYSQMRPFGSTLRRPATPALPGWQPRMLSDVPPLVEKVGGPSWWKVGVGSRGGGAGAPIIPPFSTAVLRAGVTDGAPGPFYLTGVAVLAVRPTTAQGYATAQVPIVLTPAMIGVPTFLQWTVIDGGGNIGWSESSIYRPL